MGIIERTERAWNMLIGNEKKPDSYDGIETGLSGSAYGGSYITRRYSRNELLDPIITRIAIDVSELKFNHVKRDDNPSTELVQKSGLNTCISEEANVDQISEEFIQDLVWSMCDEGCVAAVPVCIDDEPEGDLSIMAKDIITMRTGKVSQWYQKAVVVDCYDEVHGCQTSKKYSKEDCAIIQNPLYAVMNAPNSTMQRLARKIQLIDIGDERVSSKKWNLIIQTPYSLKGDLNRKRAKDRIEEMEHELEFSSLGISHIGPEENVIQLNRSIDNNLIQEIESLRKQLMNELGMTEAVFNGTATEMELQLYYNRTVNVIANRICKEFSRKFLSKTARTQGHKIIWHTNPFKFVPASTVAGAADTLKRNEVTTTNEIRENIGLPLSDDPKANMLTNPNMPLSEQVAPNGLNPEGGETSVSDEEAAQIIDSLDDKQFGEFVDYVKTVAPEGTPDEQLLDSLNEEQFKMVMDKAKEIKGDKLEENEDEDEEE